MKTIENIPSDIIELELQIKLLDYLKTNKYVNDTMYNYVVNKIINKMGIYKREINS